MKIITVNCGSSSVKFSLFNRDTSQIEASAIVERIGESMSVYKHEALQEKYSSEFICKNHKDAVSYFFETLTQKEIIKDVSEIKAVGHRLVHGGEFYTGSVRITEDVIEKLENHIYLAPLHNPANIAGIRATEAIIPDAVGVGIFDTAFHGTIPQEAYIYPVPYEWYKGYGIRRYGFHGTSHLYVSKRAAHLLDKKAEDCNIISLHIGNGASACAIRGGVSVDTSMGMSPLEGLVMGTRSGDVDPSIIQTMSSLLRKDVSEIIKSLNSKSGVLGMTQQFSDRRDVEARYDTNELCKLAIDVECYRIKKYIGSYMAALGRVDAIVFTAGVGENATKIRELALEGMEDLGIVLNKEVNNKTRSSAGETFLSDPDSRVKVLMIPTDEERVFIEDTIAVLEDNYSNHMEFEYSFK